MPGNTAELLKNVCIERDMPAGYTWIKFRSCWTSEPGSGRFFPEQKNENSGNLMPAAYFCSLIVYDPAAGYHERDVKFQGSEALAMERYNQRGVIVRIDAEGHLVTKARQQADGYVARSTVFIKQGTLKVLEECVQTPVPASMGMPEAPPVQARAAADLGNAAAAALDDLTEIEPLAPLTPLAVDTSTMGLDADTDNPKSLWPTLTALAATCEHGSEALDPEVLGPEEDECPF